MLVEIIVRNRFEIRPKISREYVNMSGTILYFMSKNAAEIENNIVIIILFALLVWRGFTIAMRSSDKFGSMLAIGLTFQVGLQAMLNIWVVTNTIPNTGISLPFFSYGGTALIVNLVAVGLLISVSRKK